MKRELLALCALARFISPSTANASELYGMGYSTRTLYRLSQTNGAATVIGGNYPTMTMRDLASDTRPESFRMWATGFNKQLFRINPITGAATLIGTYGLSGSEEIRTLAYDMVGGKLDRYEQCGADADRDGGARFARRNGGGCLGELVRRQGGHGRHLFDR